MVDAIATLPVTLTVALFVTVDVARVDQCTVPPYAPVTAAVFQVPLKAEAATPVSSIGDTVNFGPALYGLQFVVPGDAQARTWNWYVCGALALPIFSTAASLVTAPAGVEVVVMTPPLTLDCSS